MMKLCGLKQAVITGGTGGLGTVLTEQFREAGWAVTALGSKDLDLGDRDAVDRYFAGKGCDLLICAAGMVRDQPLAWMDEGTWDELFMVNYRAAANCARAALRGMADRGKGHVIFFSSYAALHPAVGQAAYATAKAALLGLTEDLALLWGKKGLRVNAVLPGFLETPMTAAVSEKRRELVRAEHFLGEFNTEEAAAAFVLFLEERMQGTSGQIFQLDSRR